MESQENTVALLEQARDLLDKGEATQARLICEEICRNSDPANLQAWLTLGDICLELDAIDESVDAARHAINLQADCPEAWLVLGYAEQQRGNADQAEHCFRRAVQLAPDDVGAQSALALLLAQRGESAQAIPHFERALASEPNDIELLINLAVVYQRTANAHRSDAILDKVLQLQPGNPQALTGLGFSSLARRAYEQARGYFERVLERDKLNPEAHYGMGAALAQVGKTERALASMREAVRLAPDHLRAWTGMIGLLLTAGQPQEVLTACNEVLRLQPGNADAMAISSWVLARSGKHEQAAERLRPVMHMAGDNVRVGLALAALAGHLDQYDVAIERLEKLLAGNRVGTPYDRRRVLFELGRLCDKRGEYDKAFAYYRQANMLAADSGSRHSIDVRTRAGQQRTQALLDAHSLERHARWPRSSNTSALPVFIIGMPRSGTTLVEQILASHPDVRGAGELNWLAQLSDTLPGRIGCAEPYPRNAGLLTQPLLDNLAGEYLERLEARAAGASRVTDKMPGNYNLLGLVDLLFPGARVIHCARHPLDTCLSIYFQEFRKGNTYSGELIDVGKIYLQYRQLMAHWKKVLKVPVLEIRYEDLVEEQENISRELVQFCGLPWDERCLRFYENDRHIGTASHDQVNKPIYRGSLERWKHYTTHLDALRDLLEDDAQTRQ